MVTLRAVMVSGTAWIIGMNSDSSGRTMAVSMASAGLAIELSAIHWLSWSPAALVCPNAVGMPEMWISGNVAGAG